MTREFDLKFGTITPHLTDQQYESLTKIEITPATQLIIEPALGKYRLGGPLPKPVLDLIETQLVGLPHPPESVGYAADERRVSPRENPNASPHTTPPESAMTEGRGFALWVLAALLACAVLVLGTWFFSARRGLRAKGGDTRGS